MISGILDRLGRTHANHRRIASGALWIGLLVLGAKLFVAAREMAIAWRYGIGREVDAYQLAVTITTWLPLMLGATAAVVLVPRLVALKRSGGGYRGFVGELNGSVLIVGVGLALLTWVGAPWAAELLTGGLDRETRALTAAMAGQMAPLGLLALVGGYLTARLQARERYAYSALDAVPALLITSLVIAAPAGTAVWPLVAGTLIGSLLQALWLGRMVWTSDPPLGAIRFRHRSEEWRSLYASLLVMGLGQLFITATIPVDQAFAAQVGEGAVATLGYVNRIITLVTGFGSVVFARALLPVLSGAVADGNFELGRRQALQWATIMFALATAGALAAWLLAPLGVQILFERGAFGARETEIVTGVLRYGLIQLPPFFGGIVLVQWYAAAGRYRAILAVTLIAFLTKVGINLLLVERLGVAGIMISTAAMYLVTLLLMILASGRRANGGA